MNWDSLSAADRDSLLDYVDGNTTADVVVAVARAAQLPDLDMELAVLQRCEWALEYAQRNLANKVVRRLEIRERRVTLTPEELGEIYAVRGMR
jgi:hypothetical protein